jgi:cytochrome c biogenesis protein
MATAQSSVAKPKPLVWNAIDFVLDILSSVPFGLVILMLLIAACMVGMLIQQQELETFPAYYAALTPAEKLVYGKLGFFDIYHATYFNVLLLLLSLSIILTSIDHFPAAWSFIAKKKLTASPTFAKSQRIKDEIILDGESRAELVERAATAARKFGLKTRITEEESRTTVFAEKGAWNRLGAYAVHVALLTIFAGGFLTSRGFTGSMTVQPDKTSDRMAQNVFNVDSTTLQHQPGMRELELPFTVEGLDIQQKLIDKSKGIDAGNTLDWITRVKITDKTTNKTEEALIHMNAPHDVNYGFNGYRMFQASVNPLGNAREIKLRVQPKAGGAAQEVTIRRNGQHRLSDGTVIKFVEFNPSFTVNRDGRAEIGGTDYDNPAAHLSVLYPDGDSREVWAFNEAGRGMIESAPFLRDKFGDTGGLQFTLLDFEKVPFAHILSIQYDPGVKVVYLGFTMLCVLLCLIYMFSHQRLWLVVEDGKVTLGGDANRNRLGFEDRVKKIAAPIRREPLPVSE